MSLGSRIRERREALGLSQADLALELGYNSRSSIAKIEAGINDLTQSKIIAFAEALNTSPDYLMEWTDDPTNYDDPALIAELPKDILEWFDGDVRAAYKFKQVEAEDAQRSSSFDNKNYDNIQPIKTQRIPMLGEIACGEPIFAAEDRESYVEVGTEIKADFCLKAKGDSMINARILDGDIIFIRQQSIVENGEIAAVIIDDEATLKRVYYDREHNKLVLNAENPKYPPMVYVNEELDTVRILGKAIAFQSDVI